VKRRVIAAIRYQRSGSKRREILASRVSDREAWKKRLKSRKLKVERKKRIGERGTTQRRPDRAGINAGHRDRHGKKKELTQRTQRAQSSQRREEQNRGGNVAEETGGVANAATEGAAEVGGAPKVKTRKPKQRACDEKDAKGKVCAGHLKRWFEYPAEIEKLVGKGAEIYRCEFCKTLYRPDPGQKPNSYTVRY
jgi:hypothetical protein